MTMILPPVEVPASEFFPAFKVTALVFVELVTTLPVSVRSPAKVSTVRLPLTVEAPSVTELASDSDTVAAPGMVTVPKSLLLSFRVKLPLPVRARLYPDALKTPPDIVLVLTTLNVLSDVTVTVRLTRSTSPVASSVPPPRTMLPLPIPEGAAMESVPSVTVVAPVKVLTPCSIQVPASFLVSVPAPVVIVPLIMPLPAPSSVRFLSAAVTALGEAGLSVSVPASDWIVAWPASVTVPPQVFAPLTFRNAPLSVMPLPVRLNGSSPTKMPPCSSRAAPSATVTPPAVVPVP